jgi:hypothetical protein
MKKILLVPMSICWLYLMSAVLALILIHLAILLSAFIPNNVLGNVMAFITELGNNGIVGLVALIVFVGQYILAYRLYLFFKARAA